MPIPASRPATVASMPSWWQSLSAANVFAGLSAIVIYLAGPLPLYLGAIGEMDSPAAVPASGLFVAFFAAGAGTIVLALWTKQPLAVGWSLPGLLYLVAASQRYEVEALVGACLVSGVVLLVLGLSGLADRLARLLPMPVVMAVLAGTALQYCTGAVTALEAAPAAAGAAVAAFFVSRALGLAWLPPVAAALFVGMPVAMLSGGDPATASMSLPALHPAMPSLETGALLTLVPLLVSASLLGNLQGFAIMEVEGYRGHRNLTTIVVGGMTIVQAFFVAPPATMQRASMALLAGNEAGHRDYRYVAATIASVGAIAIAFFASPAAAFAASLPPGFIASLVGLVLLSIVLDALSRGLSSNAPQGAFITFVVAVSGVTFWQFDASLLALVAGVGASLLLDRPVPSGAPSGK